MLEHASMDCGQVFGRRLPITTRLAAPTFSTRRIQENMMSPQVSRIFFIVVFLISVPVSRAQNSLTAKTNFQPANTAATASESDRANDGLIGPVRRVRTEIVKLSSSAGKTVEEPKRVLLETAEYDIKGTKTQNQY